MQRKHTKASRAQRPVRRRLPFTEQLDRLDHGKIPQLDLSAVSPTFNHCKYNPFEILTQHGEQDVASVPTNKRPIPQQTSSPAPALTPYPYEVALAIQGAKEGDPTPSPTRHLHQRAQSRPRSPTVTAFSPPPCETTRTLSLSPSRAQDSTRLRHGFAPSFLRKRHPSTLHHRQHSRFFGPHATISLESGATSTGINFASAQTEQGLCAKQKGGEAADFEMVTEAEEEDEWTVVFPVQPRPVCH